jgi:hypothetical protein
METNDATFALEESELAPIHSRFGADVLPSRTVQLFNGYINRMRFLLTVDEASAARSLVTKAEGHERRRVD